MSEQRTPQRQHPIAPTRVFAPVGLQVRTRHEARRFTIALQGDLDLATVAKLRDAIAEACDTDCAEVVLDLTGLTFVDSSGLHAILELHAAASDEDRRLTVVPGPGRVQRALEVAGLGRLLPLADERSHLPG